jgi:hypothetical protein
LKKGIEPRWVVRLKPARQDRLFPQFRRQRKAKQAIEGALQGVEPASLPPKPMPFGEEMREFVEGPRAKGLLGMRTSGGTMEAQESLSVILIAEETFLASINQLPGHDAFAFDKLG